MFSGFKRGKENETAADQPSAESIAVAIKAMDRAYEPDFLALLHELNASISTTGEAIEGNLCYWNHTPAAEYAELPPIPDDNHVRKRINFAKVAATSNLALEIGLNGGHSALLALYCNPRLIFFSVDIGAYRYTALAAEFLKEKFRHRFQFIAGDSRDVLPALAMERPHLKFDAIHIDGGHDAEVVFADISNAIRLARRDALFVVDDLQAPHLYAVFEKYVLLGYFSAPNDMEVLPNQLHAVVRLNKI